MSSIRKTGLDMSPYLGRRRWDQPALNLSAADWARHRAQLERHEPFRDFELERPSPDGSVWVSLSGDPVFDANGAFTGYRGIGRDITARKRDEQRVAQLGRMYAALGAANEAVLRARSADEALERACEIAVEAGGFLLGVVYKLDAATQALRRAAASGPAALADEPDPPSLDGSSSTLVSRACRTGVPAISNDRSPDATMYEVGSAAVSRCAWTESSREPSGCSTPSAMHSARSWLRCSSASPPTSASPSRTSSVKRAGWKLSAHCARASSASAR